MRVWLVVALLASMVLAGCADGDEAETSTSETTTRTTTTTTSRAPNQPPVLLVTVLDGNGTATNVTVEGGTLFFDASASMDADDRLEAVAMVPQHVNHPNRTHEPQMLYEAGQFRTANYTFDRVGPVNVTVSGIDSRGDVSTLQFQVYVNHRVVVGETYLFTGATHEAAVDAKTCQGPTGGSQVAVDNLVWTSHGFEVQNGTTRISARILSGQGLLALCDPDGTALTDDSTTEVSTAPGTTFAAAPAIGGYYVSVYSRAPNQHVSIEVTVHYEPT